MILHAANAVMLFFLLRRLFASDRLALIVSILFAVHSIQVETVAWVSMQGIVVSTCFLLFMSLSYCKYRQESKRYFWALSIISAAFFYLSSTPALTPVLVLLGIDLVIDSKLTLTHLKQKRVIIAFWCVAFLFWTVRNGGADYLLSLASDSVAMIRLGIVEETLRIIFPVNNTLVISSEEIARHSLMFGESVYPLIFLVVSVLVIWGRKRSPVAFYGFVFFTASSIAAITARADGDWALSDHAFYLSSIGIFLIIGNFLDVGLSMLDTRKGLLWGAYAICGCAVVALAFSGRTASEYWKDNVVFWNEAHRENPDDAFILSKRGMYYYSKYDIKKSLADLNKVVELAPGDEQSYLNLGLVHLDALYPDSAIVDFRRAACLRPSDPVAYYDLGIACNKEGKYDSAESAFTKALALNPMFAQALNSRANAFAKTGNYVLAFADYQRALSIMPEYAEAYGNRAFTFLQSGNYQKALEDFQKQILLAPNRFDAKIHCGFTELLVGDTADAVSHFSSAVSADTSNGRMYLLGVAKVFLRTQQEIQAGQRIFRRIGVQ